MAKDFKPHYRRIYIALIALPLVLATAGVTLVTLDLLARVSTGANADDHERTKQVVHAALDFAQRMLANIAMDNSIWDDAVGQLYGEINEVWLEDTFATSTEQGGNYDALLVIEREVPGALAGHRHGKPFAPDLAEYFSVSPLAMLDTPSKDSPLEPRVTVTATADGLAIVAVASIRPSSAKVAVPAGRQRYLVFLRFLSADFLDVLARQYVLENLVIKSGPPDQAPGMVINDFNGVPVAHAIWTDNRPGDVAKAAVYGNALMSLAFLGLVMLAIGSVCWGLIRKIAWREAKARYEALHDMLTGLPNRVALSARIKELLGQEGTTVAVAVTDIDGFKEVNDAYGHELGDRLISAVAHGLLTLLDGRASVFRLGGDEFVAVFRGGGAMAEAERFASDLIALLNAPFDFEGRLARVGASIGIAAGDATQLDENELMRRADIAMYKAKQEGKNRCSLYSPVLDSERIDDLSIARELRMIIGQDGLDIAFQPVVDARTRKIKGVEALARWPSSSTRRLPADRFVAVAETSGLIDDLGHSILRKACGHARDWPGLKLAVNISAVQLRNPSFVCRTLTTIADSGMDPGSVELEITETRLIDDIPSAKRIFNELRAAGIKIALDDFGTGFSSIGYLRAFEFDRIKVDRSLISRIREDPSQQHIVQATMKLASGLAASVTVEGIEGEDQLEILQAIGCTEMQGYYFYKPLSAEEIKAVLFAGEYGRVPAQAAT